MEQGPGHGRMGCMVLCRTFHTAPEQGQGQHLLPPIVLVPVPVPVLVPDTTSVITPVESESWLIYTAGYEFGYQLRLGLQTDGYIVVYRICSHYIDLNHYCTHFWGECACPDWDPRPCPEM